MEYFTTQISASELRQGHSRNWVSLMGTLGGRATTRTVHLGIPEDSAVNVAPVTSLDVLRPDISENAA